MSRKEYANRFSKNLLGRIGVAVAISAASLALTALPAAAANGPAPGTHLTGACNMLRDPTMATVPMTHDAPNGTAGMYGAIAASGC